jgi:hypothetical protein
LGTTTPSSHLTLYPDDPDRQRLGMLRRIPHGIERKLARRDTAIALMENTL